MSARSTFLLAAAALLVAVVAAAIALAAAVRAGEESEPVTGGSAMTRMAGMAAMEHGAAVSPDGIPTATASRGGVRREPRIENGVYVFEFETKAVRWEILPRTRVVALTYDGLVPGPELRVPYGERNQSRHDTTSSARS